MILTTLEQWQQWAGAYTVLPYIRKYPLEETRPASWLGAWEQAAPGSFVLESGKGGRYTFLGLEPRSEIRGTGLDWVITGPAGVQERGSLPPLQAVKQWMAPYTAPYVAGAPKWAGGCIGYWGYDVIRTIERLPVQAAADLPLPDYAFVRMDELWVIDHDQKELYCSVSVHCPQGSCSGEKQELQERYEEAALAAERMYRLWEELMASNVDETLTGEIQARRERMAGDLLQIDVDAIPGLQADFPREAYVDAVNRIRDYIGAGDVFQVNLSVRQHKKLEASPEEIYEWLRLVNPSPYMGLLRFSDFQLVSGSPELLVQLERGTVRTRPIAGTRPRGGSPEEDRRLADELIHHEKERAEHIMLVDLERNDLGRISKYGTVRVSDFMVIEYYSHVMHIVSEVEGQLAEGRDAFDVIAATFPGGTITGAPKIRTMQIIEELEPVRRGPYTGSIGWIDYNGDMEFNIIIRTLVAAEGTGYVQAGAGIVIDSVPDKEYVESINKAKAMWKAIQYSEAVAIGRGRG
ncbi:MULTISPECIES: anthranilate synthase component I family protein [Paenibacillus]|uniref:anthranilate synthase component I family protein n=1 Tax=Paenibacillus TaxID=44249 RepID=UPI0022B89DA2|nr:anthranilate synthase component I family protein [Paenibacillus caseinilyticus]MCZ8523678.1 anthranilate synthase component I family protein [Paenibacillus caseinilyticus]